MNQQPNNQASELRGTGEEVLRHLKKHQPNLYKYLVSKGQVMQYVLQAQEQAENYMEKADAAGRPPEETEEIIRETWISLPDVDQPQDATITPADSLTTE